MSHFVFFCAGLTPFGAWHNQNMKELFDAKLPKDVQFYPLTSLLSIIPMYQLVWGIDYCSETIWKEIQGVLAEKPEVTKISFLGSSMGGIVFRHVIWKMQNYSEVNWGKCATDRASYEIFIDRGRTVELHTYVSLATPHMGAIREKFWTGMRLLNIGCYLNPTVRDLADLYKTNSSVWGMIQEEQIAAMLRWKHCVTFVPDIDDGVVHPASAAMNSELFSKDEKWLKLKYWDLEYDLNKLKWEKIIVNGANHRTVARLGPYDECRDEVANKVVEFITK